MISFERFELENGLRVLYHKDENTPIAAMNILYDVGARDEDPERTGFAHLFEHLMFGGSINIHSYDEPLQDAGGENNAFTNNDITNYYLSLPVDNLETGFWLESDRMLNLAFTPKSLEVQRQVVIEEYRQRYLNQPYGDVWLLLRPLAYKVHPYRWPTIGKEIRHIEEAVMDDVKAFFKKYYRPDNAILCVAGNLELDHVKAMTEKWFGPIPRGEAHERALPQEPEQQEYRLLEVERDVPQDAIYMVFHMCDRLSPDYYPTDLLSDILSKGESSRLYQHLVKELKLFTEIDAYIMGDRDPGLFVFQGKFQSDLTHQQAEEAIWNEIERFKNEAIQPEELEKVINKLEASVRFGEINVLNKAMALCMAEWLGDADLVNTEIDRYRSVTLDQIKQAAEKTLRRENCSVLHYKMKAK